MEETYAVRMCKSKEISQVNGSMSAVLQSARICDEKG